MHYDLVVIGSGPAGEKAAALAAYHGRRVAVIERAPQPGGTMVNGVASTKTMREAAIYLTSFRRRAIYGVGMDMAPQLAVRGVQERTRQVEQLLAASVRDNLDRHGIELIRGTARLLSPGRVGIELPNAARRGAARREVTGDVVLIATGARPFHPPGMPFDHGDVLDSEAACRLDRPVRSVVVIGGGAVACEYASIFAALGSEVTLIEPRARLLPFVDDQIAQLLTEAFRDEGIVVHLGAGRVEVTGDGDGAVVRTADGTVRYPSKVIVAAGRAGNTEGLGLAELGVTMDDRGHVSVDEHYATNIAGVYAAGDVTGPPGLASVSMEQGRVAMCHAFGIDLRGAVDSHAPFGVYSIPEVAMIGLTEEAARAAYDDVLVGQARLSRNARTAITGGPQGLVKLVFRRGDDQRLLGAHILGDNATELIHLAQAVIAFDGGIRYFINTTFTTPSEAEAFKYAAYDGLSRVEDRPTLTVNA